MEKLPGRVRMSLEHIPVPEIAAEIRIGDEQLVVREVGMLHGTIVHIRRKDRSRNGGDQPASVIKSSRRNFLTGGGHLRRTLQFPGSAGKQLAGAFAGGSRFRDRLRAALAIHFPLAQFKRLSIPGAGQAQADIAAFGTGELDFRFRPLKSGDILPGLSVLGSLDRRPLGPVDPGKAHLVESGRLAQVDGNPFFLRAGTLPGTDETGVREYVHERIVLEEKHFVHGKAVGGSFEMELVCAEFAGNRDGELPRVDEHRVLRRLGTGGTQRLPGTVFRLPFHGQDRFLQLVPARGDEDPVGLRFKAVENEFQVHRRAGAIDAGMVLVGQESALETGDQRSAPEYFHPGGRSVGLQSVRQELRRLVVVRTGGMPGGAQQRDIPVSVPFPEGRGEILVRIARIDADAQRPGSFVSSAGSRQEQRQENERLFHAYFLFRFLSIRRFRVSTERPVLRPSGAVFLQ